MKRKMLSRILAAAMAVLMLALSGCGGSGSSGGSSTPAAPQAEDGVLRMTAAFADPIDPACTMDSVFFMRWTSSRCRRRIALRCCVVGASVGLCLWAEACWGALPWLC